MSLLDLPLDTDFNGTLVGLPDRTFRRVHDKDLHPRQKMDQSGCKVCCFELENVGVTDQCAKVTCGPVNEIWTHFIEVTK